MITSISNATISQATLNSDTNKQKEYLKELEALNEKIGSSYKTWSTDLGAEQKEIDYLKKNDPNNKAKIAECEAEVKSIQGKMKQLSDAKITVLEDQTALQFGGPASPQELAKVKADLENYQHLPFA